MASYQTAQIGGSGRVPGLNPPPPVPQTPQSRAEAPGSLLWISTPTGFLIFCVSPAPFHTPFPPPSWCRTVELGESWDAQTWIGCFYVPDFMGYSERTSNLNIWYTGFLSPNQCNTPKFLLYFQTSIDLSGPSLCQDVPMSPSKNLPSSLLGTSEHSMCVTILRASLWEPRSPCS